MISKTTCTLIMVLAAGCAAIEAPHEQAACVTAAAYGADPKQTLDIYPSSLAGSPVLVFFHGGAWRSGDKSELADFASALAEQGVTVVSPNYRSALDGHLFPAQIEDAADAAAWTHDNIGACGGDASQVFVGGHSAGGHLAALLAVDPAWRARALLGGDDLRGVVTMGGIFKIETVEGGFPRSIVESVFGDDEADWSAASPLAVIQNDASAARALRHFVLVGQDEHELTRRESRRWADALAAAGAEVEMREVAGADHAGAPSAVADPSSPVNNAFLAWIAG